MTSADPSTPRAGRTRLVLGLALVLLLLLLLGLLSRPRPATGLLLRGVGNALGLEITASGDNAYGLRGTPTLVLRDVVAREPGSATPLLRASRLYVALPWSTIRARGALLEATRLELDAPVLDLPALQHWLATRPPGKTRIPTLSRGLRVRDGVIANDDWRIEGLAVDIARLHPDEPLRMRVRGRYVAPPLSVPADLAIAVASPADLAQGGSSGVAGVGALGFAGDHWRASSQVTLSGPLRLGKDSALLRPMTFGVAARYQSNGSSVRFTLGLHGPMAFNNASWRVVPMQAVLHGDANVPDLRGRGSLSLGRQLALHLVGDFAAWPAGWPALPAPLSQSTSPLPFALKYAGRMDLGDVTTLALQRDAARFDGRFRIPDVSAWADAAAGGTPLPPLTGTLHAPRLVIAGTELEGVDATLDDGATDVR